MPYSLAMPEEEFKNRIAQDYFAGFDTAQIIGKINFCIAAQAQGKGDSLLWTEAKKGSVHDIFESFVQLVLTIGRAKTYELYLLPAFLGAFDAEKIAFLPYHALIALFSSNDFNWNVAPSDHSTKEFCML